MKARRPVIIINEESGERLEFASTYHAGRALGASHVQVLNAIWSGQAVKGWKVYDMPDKIRERIADLENQLKLYENENEGTVG